VVRSLAVVGQVFLHQGAGPSLPEPGLLNSAAEPPRFAPLPDHCEERLGPGVIRARRCTGSQPVFICPLSAIRFNPVLKQLYELVRTETQESLFEVEMRKIVNLMSCSHSMVPPRISHQEGELHKGVKTITKSSPKR